jgi:hypothetical protein
MVSWIFWGVLTSVSLAHGQQQHHCTVSGRIVDDSTSGPLQNVDVFIANTTLGCGTDTDGRFEIRSVPAGSYQLVASRVGYSLNTTQIVISGESKRIFRIRLRPAAIRVGEMLVTAPDPSEWRAQLRKFVGLLIGRTRNASNCRIVNPEVLDFQEDQGVFSATARGPLEIENDALGYHLRFYLTVFRMEREYLTYEGLPQYTQVKSSSPGDSVHWLQARERAYAGSLRHFLASLMKETLSKQGFTLFRMKDIADVSGRKPVPDDSLFLILSGTARHFVRSLQPNGILEVEYSRESVEQGYDLLRRDGTDSQVSWLVLNHPVVMINARGLIRDFFPTRVYGYWSWERLADMLPLDFEPQEQ